MGVVSIRVESPYIYMRLDKDSLRSRAGDCGENDLVALHLGGDRSCGPMTVTWLSMSVWKTWGMGRAAKSRPGCRVTGCRSVEGSVGGFSGPVFPGLNRLSTEMGGVIHSFGGAAVFAVRPCP